MIGLIRGFLRFWYHFVIGDDWTAAAAVALGFAGTWVLLRAGVAAWWVLPVVVVAITAVGLRRAQTRG